MLKKILGPLDGSALADQALPYAITLAQATGGQIFLRGVLRAAEPLTPKDEAVIDLVSVVDRVSAAGVPVESRLMGQGYPEQVAECIIEAAAEQQADLIVMATHGYSCLGRWFHGSVADEVMREAAAPVLLVPASTERAWPSDRPLRVMMPLDGSDLARTALEPAAELAAALSAELYLLRVVETLAYEYADPTFVPIEPEAEWATAQRYLTEVASPLLARGLAVATQVELGEPTALIDSVARQRQIDLIVIARPGRGGLSRLLMGSVATSLLHRAHRPIWLIGPAAIPNGPAEHEPTRANTG